MPDLQGISVFFCTGSLLCSECFGLVNIDPRHQPVKLLPGKVSDFRLLLGLLIATTDKQALIDQNKTIRFPE